MEYMQTKLLNVRLPVLVFKELQDLTAKEGYSSIQELIKEILRNRVKKSLQEQAIAFFEKNYGSQKGRKKLLSKKQMDKILIKQYEKEFNTKF